MNLSVSSIHREFFIIVSKHRLYQNSQDDGAFAIAQALKSNEDVAVTSLNLGSNFLTKFGQVLFSAFPFP